MKKTAVIVGTGAGGAAVGKELMKRYHVVFLEEGKDFHPFGLPVNGLASLRKSGLFLDERMIHTLFPNMIVRKSKDMVHVNGRGVGGTTTLATGNAVRYDGALRELGIDLDREFEELYEELPITTEHEKYWDTSTRDLWDAFVRSGITPQVTPKLLKKPDCARCGHCAIGCPTGAKWDTREIIEECVALGAELRKGCRAVRFETENGRVTGLRAVEDSVKLDFHADLYVLAAGGLGTPEILSNSGIPVTETLFGDPVLAVAAHMPGFHQEHQILMPFISQHDGYILSPYMDYLSFFFNKKWRLPITDIASVMIKMADESVGSVRKGKIEKELTERDKEILHDGVRTASRILKNLGARKEDLFLGTVNEGHPGGMLPLTEKEARSLHSPLLPENLYVADATILPRSMGNPPILTIMALARKIARTIDI